MSGESREVVDGARVRRPRVPDDEEGREPLAPVRGDRLFEKVEADPERVVRRNLPDAPRGKSGEGGRLRDAVVRLVADVEDAPEEVLGKAVAARRDDRGEVRERAAAREEAAGSFGEADEAGKPPEDVRLELDEERAPAAKTPMYRFVAAATRSATADAKSPPPGM